MNIPAPPERPPNKDTKGESRLNLGTLAAIATIAALVVAVATFVLQFFGPSWGIGANISPQSSAQTSIAAETRGHPAPAPSANPPASSPGAVQGSCLDGSWAPASCDRAHSAELVSTNGTCDLQALTEFAGGKTPADTLRHDLVPTALDGVGCVVTVPSGLTATIQNGLSSQEHAALRQCWDRFADRDVSCDQTHTAEVVYTGSGTEAGNCRSQADAYTADAFSRYETRLELLSRDSDGAVSCLVQIKGSNDLKGSLRNLGTKALPASPRS
ncbi:hypothetical protein [Paenarthrobacter nitroguajacolicus]|uniref:hypothetical protein n=1 Tax=Paenarthrobacter nitroguajacolicus TaxID=211146 RepID=UPI00248BA9DD|nr:hypothetical protein [Paenarthrobacter nitroguajacolicus]MDI2034773.1 hypothetical protein [Paenarthrobacter nitroguajacolicus]